MKLAKDGPTEQGVLDVGRHIRLRLKQDKPSNVKPEVSSLNGHNADANERPLRQLCQKLLEYARLVTFLHEFTSLARSSSGIHTQQFRR